LCSYITDHVDEPLPLSKLSEISGLSPFHLQRKFKAAFGISPRQFADQRRLERLKSSMRSGFSVTDAIYDAGFGSSSRVYERSASQLGMTPKQYRNGGASETIHYAFEQTPFGLLLVAATALGICAIQFGDSETTLLKNLAAEFPDAVLQPGSDELASHLSQLSRWLAGQRVPLDLPLDIRATTFQRLVWEYLKKIPYGETRSYSQIAHDLGAPNATRAVARACATNPVALAIPCHRVVKQDGKLAGYRWGIDRKRSLLDLEQGRSAAPGNQLPQIGV
jgi:AraC family transcriptional regulator of adaptative response/methylated-DNA-[protein]-cysteine methyltransferase